MITNSCCLTGAQVKNPFQHHFSHSEKSTAPYLAILASFSRSLLSPGSSQHGIRCSVAKDLSVMVNLNYSKCTNHPPPHFPRFHPNNLAQLLNDAAQLALNINRHEGLPRYFTMGDQN
jgi:hypothetical protein